MRPYALAVLFMAGLAAGWTSNGWRLGAQIDSMLAEHSKATGIAEARARQIESGWYAGINEVQKNAKAKHEELAAHLSDADAAAERLREQVDRLSRRPAACPKPSSGSPPTEAITRVLSELLNDLDRMAGAYAAEAGRYRLAGVACEVAHDLLSDTQ